MKCPNCGSEHTKMYSKTFQRVVFGVATLLSLFSAFIFIPFIIVPLVFGTFFVMTFFNANAYKCHNCKKRFTETQAKAINSH